VFGVRNLNLGDADPETPRRLPHADYVFHWAGCSQEDDQLLCVKDGSGAIHAEGATHATRLDLDRWMRTLPQPWTAAMETAAFAGWISDHLRLHAAAPKVAHPLMLRAIAAAKKKNDCIDANKICDCLRCDFLAECYMASTARILSRKRHSKTMELT